MSGGTGRKDITKRSPIATELGKKKRKRKEKAFRCGCPQPEKYPVPKIPDMECRVVQSLTCAFESLDHSTAAMVG